jgi:hypothetical protein
VSVRSCVMTPSSFSFVPAWVLTPFRFFDTVQVRRPSSSRTPGSPTGPAHEKTARNGVPSAVGMTGAECISRVRNTAKETRQGTSDSLGSTMTSLGSTRVR